ncbi:putative acid--CoA ligase [Frankia canadensis]|uniref:Putative acid--CoA ligase n=1 Tax=Frankia canadensis TaxID=1836972 RepID=A0A2I2KY58_9ACTN|nr:class I adenylate-forming enzyme family protein [Frankia canadensis]SNQ50601.1 putative acid--CoA ligase [Frankia canadensis]SOU57891.1 putative acid--CoA ligase [Frankia canadensis]
MNIAIALRRVGLRTPHRVAIRHDGVETTYADFLDQAGRVANWLRQNGVEPGQRVGILMHNQLEWLVAMMGIWQAGCVLVPYNYLSHPAAIRHATLDADVRWIFTPADDVSRLRDALRGLPAEDRVVSVGRAEGAGSTVTWDEVLSLPTRTDVVPRFDTHDAVLMYTSGSTGNPKGVRQTHRNTVAVSEAAIDVWELTERDHALVSTPLFHVGGLQLISLPTLLTGGEVTLRRWKVREWLEDAAKLRPTFMALVPAMMIDIVNELGGKPFPLNSVRVCAIGGSALPQSRLKALTDVTGIVPVNIYGQTEQSGLSITEPPHEARREGSLGRPLEQIVQIRVIRTSSEQPEDASAGEVGELWVRGDAVTPGYWQLPETNASKFTDGWFRTSDLVRQAPDGYLYYVDRTDDLIISGGENVFPQMVEGHLAACPLIAEVAVIGTPHERLSNQVTAIVVPSRPGVTAQDIAAYCDAEPNLRGLQRPRRIEIVDAIPRTATNKIDRPLLKRTYARTSAIAGQ